MAGITYFIASTAMAAPFLRRQPGGTRGLQSGEDAPGGIPGFDVLFAVLPGPLPPLHTLDAVIETAASWRRPCTAPFQDSHGAPLSMQRAEALREDVARFQAQLT